MTYVAFLALFLVVPLAVLAGLLRRRLLDRRFPAYGAMLLISPLYMVPRVHAAYVSRLWDWSIHQTLGIRWWSVPPEEYAFCLLEALLAVTLLYGIFLWRVNLRSPEMNGSPERRLER